MSHCRLYPQAPEADPAVLAALGKLPVTVVSDQLERGGGIVGLLPIAPLAGRVVAGRALTVKTRPGDNLVVHKAADIAEPGDFIIIDAGGAVDRAIIGELWCRHALSKGVVAVAVDGAVRDAHALRELDLPVFARAVIHQGPFKVGPGELRGPIAAGGTVVHSGDYLVGDDDGLVTVPAARAAEVVAAAERRLEEEERMLQEIAEGRLDRSWLDDALTMEEID